MWTYQWAARIRHWTMTWSSRNHNTRYSETVMKKYEISSPDNRTCDLAWFTCPTNNITGHVRRTGGSVEDRNIEREMLGVVYALTKFHQYTYGRHITVITDHKPLESLRKKNINDCPARLQRMFLRIQAYDYTIVYRAGSKIPIPDCLSRCISSRAGRHLPGMNVQVNNISLTHASKLDEVREHLQKDDDLLQLRDMTLSGWPSDRSHVPASLLAYWPYKDELAYYSGVLLKGSRIIIPSSLRSAVLKDIHRGHLGIEKCRLRARRWVFWPNMNIDISYVVHACEICQSHAAPQPKQYTYTPWQMRPTVLCRLLVLI